ncbi:efflux RND transporter periplasmic adaptor subunit [Bacillus sp. RG28]|uniref:Efflux RND transporter periplasmic adaptor subunit n=1 Tax=Gottfriedia endophytica TaxID=2820819 RepID=A0A940NR45_9BACI|nr:efflux RND transporter periplasmic adaptor subunit [Gottfriedia endophytica]MBP0725437.1 efflux RND transporter periplasmic adaptor subunit [Gottfriedia endophytica]
MKKWLIIGILIIVVFGGGAFYVIKSKAQTQTNNVTMRTDAVRQGDLQVNVSGSGAIDAIDSKDLMTSTNSTIDQIKVSLNQQVNKGEKLITFADGSDPITAPFSGVVSSLPVAVGDQVNRGTVVAHITNNNNLETKIDVDELDITKVKVGQKVSIKLNADPDGIYTGKVTSIANEGTVNNGVSTFSVTVLLDQVKNAKVGMTTESTINVETKKNVLYVPIEAVHTQNNKKFVYVLTGSNNPNNTSPEKREVTTGSSTDSYVEIKSGLQVGDQVILPQIQSSTNSFRFGFGGGGGGGRMMFGGKGNGLQHRGMSKNGGGN